MPPWKHRRRLIYGTCVLSAAMIAFAAATYRSDTQIGTQLIIGGVSLLSITLTAYTAFASYEDVKLWRSVGQSQLNSSSEEELPDDQIPAS